MQEQKKYHQRKLAIIEMIEECDRCINNAEDFKNRITSRSLGFDIGQKNINRYQRIKDYLTLRYSR